MRLSSPLLPTKPVIVPSPFSRARWVVRGLFVTTVVAVPATFLLVWGGFGRLLERVSLLPVERVRIELDWPLTDDAVRGKMPPVEGKSLLSLRPDALAERVLSLPWAASVSVRREFPDTVRIRVRSKRAVAMTVDRGRPHFLDEGGTLIAPAMADELGVLDVPVLGTAVGQEDRWSKSALLAAVEDIRRNTEPLARLSQLVADRPPWIFLYFSSPRWEVVVSYEELDEQLPRLRRLLDAWPAIEANAFPKNADTAPRGYRVSLLVRGKAIIAPLPTRSVKNPHPLLPPPRSALRSNDPTAPIARSVISQ